MLAQWMASPAKFRAALWIDADNGEGMTRRLADACDPWQAADFAALDPAWLTLTGQGPTLQKTPRWAYLERPRGHSKTNDLAVMATWALFASKRKLRGYAAAADKDQAALLRDAIDGIIRLNPWLGDILDCKQHEVTNARTGSRLTILSSDAATSYGLTPDFVIIDELTHWLKRDLWDSLLSAAAKRKHCVLAIISNAGFEESWQWETREAIRKDEDWLFSRLDGPQASWITADRLARQQKLLPTIAYQRLWLNQWTAGAGDALTDELITRATTLTGPPKPEAGWAYVAGVDLGLARDASAVVVLGRHVGQQTTQAKPRKLSSTQEAMIQAGVWDEPEPTYVERCEKPTGRIRLMATRVWQPRQGQRVSLDQVERTLLRLDERFGLTAVGFDPWQAALLQERISKQGINAVEVPFTPQNLTGMCTALLEGFNENLVELYAEPTLNHDLRRLQVVEKSYGCRLDSPRGVKGHGGRGDGI